MTEPSILVDVGVILGCLVVYLAIGIAFVFAMLKLHIFGIIGDDTVSLLWDYDSIDEAAIAALFWPLFMVAFVVFAGVAVVVLPFVGLHKILSIILRKLFKDE